MSYGQQADYSSRSHLFSKNTDENQYYRNTKRFWVNNDTINWLKISHLKICIADVDNDVFCLYLNMKTCALVWVWSSLVLNTSFFNMLKL